LQVTEAHVLTIGRLPHPSQAFVVVDANWKLHIKLVIMPPIKETNLTSRSNMDHFPEQQELELERFASALRPRAPWTYNVDLVFLVGCPRSGTTWLQAMIASHPAIYTGPETRFFALFGALEKEFQRPDSAKAGLPVYCTKEDFYKVMAELFWSFISALNYPPSKAKYFLEKTPHHCLFSEFILNTFPNARFIHLIRDGRAVVSSMLRASKSWGQHWAPETVDKATQSWLSHTNSGRMIAQQTKGTDQYIEVRYEDIRQNPHYQMSKLFEWLGLPTKESLINSAVDSNALDKVTSSKEPFASIPMIDGNTIVPKAKTAYPEGFIGSASFNVEDIQLSQLQRLRVEYLAGKLLQELGYPEVKPQLSMWEKIATSSKVRRKLRLPLL